MTRFSDEWLDAKMANIARWKREEAARSAAKQSTSGSTEGRAPEMAPFGTTGVEGEMRELTRQPGGGTPGGTRRATKRADLATALPVPQLESSPARSPSTAGAASPAGDTLPPVAAPAPPNATKADAQLTDAPGATSSHDGAAARRQPDGGVIAASSGTKYRNRPTDGYHSKREARRAAALRLMQEAGQIRGLREQVEFLLIPRQKRPDGTTERSCSYWADFVYDEWTADGWKMVVEDVKGMRTREYVIKRKLMLMVHGVAIREV